MLLSKTHPSSETLRTRLRGQQHLAFVRNSASPLSKSRPTVMKSRKLSQKAALRRVRLKSVENREHAAPHASSMRSRTLRPLSPRPFKHHSWCHRRLRDLSASARLSLSLSLFPSIKIFENVFPLSRYFDFFTSSFFSNNARSASATAPGCSASISAALFAASARAASSILRSASLKTVSDIQPRALAKPFLPFPPFPFFLYHVGYRLRGKITSATFQSAEPRSYLRGLPEVLSLCSHIGFGQENETGRV